MKNRLQPENTITQIHIVEYQIYISQECMRMGQPTL